MSARTLLLALLLTATLPGCDLLSGSEGDPLDKILRGGGSVAGWLGIPAVGYAMTLARRLRLATDAPSRAAADVDRLGAQLAVERQANVEVCRRVARLESDLMTLGVQAAARVARGGPTGD